MSTVLKMVDWCREDDYILVRVVVIGVEVVFTAVEGIICILMRTILPVKVVSIV